VFVRMRVQNGRNHVLRAIERFDQQYPVTSRVPNGHCPNHAAGVKLPDDFIVIQLQYVE
jgi:hypothetical protein